MTWQDIYSVSLKKSVKKDFVAYSIAIDESTDVTDIAQLAVFIRGVNGLSISVELLELVPMKGKIGVHEIVSELVAL
jgi:hypothetical protein